MGTGPTWLTSRLSIEPVGPPNIEQESPCCLLSRQYDALLLKFLFDERGPAAIGFGVGGTGVRYSARGDLEWSTGAQHSLLCKTTHPQNIFRLHEGEHLCQRPVARGEQLLAISFVELVGCDIPCSLIKEGQRAVVQNEEVLKKASGVL